eukprot:TRINITY_DN2903_c0_g1_i8.p1 TRINITY_DN2903_c0_g1~~TRINITY_DN2903_c0_g1_i8.p1  ORF type:complete len:393 (-),score=59.12 TRINITY_DN2903_c0_g1_i8:107-1285(-)
MVPDLTLLGGLSEEFCEEAHHLSEAHAIALHNIVFVLAKGHSPAHNLCFLPDFVCLLLQVVTAEQAFAIAYLTLYESARRGRSSGARRYFPVLHDAEARLVRTFERHLRHNLPAIADTLTSLGVTADRLVSQWFGRVFVGVLPYDLIVRILDCFLCEGEGLFLRAGLALLSTLCDGGRTDALLTSMSPVNVPDQGAFVRAMFEFDLGNEEEEVQQEQPEQPEQRQPAPPPPVQVPTSVPSPSCDPDNVPQAYPSALLTHEQFNQLWRWLPTRCIIMEPVRLYATVADGFSLGRLYSYCAEWSPLLVIVKSAEKNLFGLFLADPLQVRAGRFSGNGETFLFTLSPNATKYGWTQLNRYYTLVEPTQLACGGGCTAGHSGYGFSIDDELHYGRL